MKKWMLPVGVAVLIVVALAWHRSATSTEGGGVSKLLDRPPLQSSSEPSALARADTRALIETAPTRSKSSGDTIIAPAPSAPTLAPSVAAPATVATSASTAAASAPAAVASAPAAPTSAPAAAASPPAPSPVESERIATASARERQAYERESRAAVERNADRREVESRLERMDRASASSARAAAAPAARTIGAAEAIRLTLATYTAAFRAQDVAAVQRVFPSANADELKQAFDKLVALDRQLEVLSLQVGADDQFAIVHAKIEDVARLKTGTTERATTMARFVMANNRSSWIIQGAELEPIKK